MMNFRELLFYYDQRCPGRGENHYELERLGVEGGSGQI